MLFPGEDGVKKVKVLSGGEKVRCLLSKMMISGANILVLDEPTNHLDMESITALNNGLIKFPGVMLFASHDHQFVETTANRIMEIMPGGQLIDKITTYDEYLASDEMAKKTPGLHHERRRQLSLKKLQSNFFKRCCGGAKRNRRYQKGKNCRAIFLSAAAAERSGTADTKKGKIAEQLEEKGTEDFTSAALFASSGN